MKKIIIIILVLVILVIYSPNIFGFFESAYIHTFNLGWLRGENTKEEVVNKYIEGLKTGNSHKIERLVPKTHKSAESIKEKIKKFKGANFYQIEIYYGNEPPQPFQVEIKNIKLKNGKIASDNIWIEEDCFQYPSVLGCEKWYLIMGTLKENYKPVPSSVKKL